MASELFDLQWPTDGAQERTFAAKCLQGAPEFIDARAGEALLRIATLLPVVGNAHDYGQAYVRAAKRA